MLSLSVNDIRERFSDAKPQENESAQPVGAVTAGAPPRRAAVLLPIVLPYVPSYTLPHDSPHTPQDQAGHDASALSVLFTRRSPDLKYHPGQISFPGGRVDAADKTIVDTALRETYEEVGIGSGHIEILGTLGDFKTTSNFNVTPVIGLLAPGFTVLAQPEEVAEVFTVPFGFLMNQSNHRWHSPKELLPNGQQATQNWLSIDYAQQGEQYRIWGATAEMTLAFYRFLKTK